MAKPDTPDTPEHSPEVVAAIPLGEWMTQMMARDAQMWEQLNQRDNQMQGQLLELFSQLLSANSVDKVVMSGFDEMAFSPADGTARQLGCAGPRAA